jgi:esterase/lipase
LQSSRETFEDPEQRKTLTLSEIIGTFTFLGKNLKFARRLDPHIAVLVIQGSNDQVLSPKSARKVFDAANTLDKRFVLIPGCGHLILGMNRQKPIVTDAIITFLKEVALRHGVVTSTAVVSQENETHGRETINSSSQH